VFAVLGALRVLSGECLLGSGYAGLRITDCPAERVAEVFDLVGRVRGAHSDPVGVGEQALSNSAMAAAS
jgi:hypothetical protein